MQSLASFCRFPPQACFVKLHVADMQVGVIKWRYWQRNVYLLKIGAESFGDGSQDICKDTESNLTPFVGL